MRQRKTLVKSVSRLFLAFLSTIFFFAFIVLLTFRLTLFSEKYIVKQAEKTEYYGELAKEINQQIQDTALGSNIPEGILAQAVSKENVKTDVNAYFHVMYTQGEKYQLTEEQKIFQHVNETVKNYAKEKNIQSTAQTAQAISDLAKQTVSIYKGYIELPFLVHYGQKLMNYRSTLLIFICVCGFLWGILSFFLFSSLKGYIHRLLRYWSYIFTGSGLMLVIVPTIFLIGGGLKRLAIQSSALYHLINAYLSNILWFFIWFGIAALAIGIICAIVSERKRKQLFG